MDIVSRAFVGNVVEGHFNDTPLAGLNWAGLYRWPGEIAEGNGKRQIVIDERADEAQRAALETSYLRQRMRTIEQSFSPYSRPHARNFARHLFLPIGLEANLELRTARVDIPGIMRQQRQTDNQRV